MPASFSDGPDIMLKHFASNGITFLLVGLVLIIGLITWGQNEYHNPGPLPENKMVEVPRGASLTKIAEVMEESGAIEHPSIFRIGVRYSGVEEEMNFGVYEIPAHASMEQIVAMLAEGSRISSRYRITYQVQQRGVNKRFQDLVDPVPADADVEAKIAEVLDSGAAVDFRVTVAEGLTSWEIVEGLKKIDQLEGAFLEVPPEGMLAPDTYSFRSGDQRQAVLDTMMAAQSRILADAWENKDPNLPIDSPQELLILASIVEKETGVPSERGQVASVFVNRLNRGMRLETDPTVIYGITKGEGPLGRGLRQSELQAETPYNTYRIPGLPPTPIANPGRASIEAAANPESTPYVFFVADGTGGHAFAETLAEHEQNVAAWRKIEAERAEQGQTEEVSE
jgi:peptidoglycan lytic transglycosylase G